MKAALQKSPIPDAHAFVVKDLKDPYFDPNWHFHPEYQLFVVLRGTGTRFVGDHVEPFREGDMVFTGPNLPHLWRSDNVYFEGRKDLYTHGIVIYFHEDFLPDSLLHTEEAIKVRKLLEKANRGMHIVGSTAQCIQQNMLELLQIQGFESVIHLLKILHILSDSREFHLLSSAGYTNSLKEGDTEKMNQVHAYVMKNFKNKISLEEVAAMANMTPTSFSRYFKTHANKNFSSFLSEIRIGYACKLLIEEKMNVAQACYSSGFFTLSNFNKQFREITGKSPVAYRKEYVQVMS